MTEFTSRATGIGGRDGRVWTDSGSLEHTVVLPGVTGGVQPEELIAAAWAACFGGTFLFVADRHGVDPGSPRFHTAVTLDSSVETVEFDIVRAELIVEAERVEARTLDRLLEESHAICPVSKLIVGGAREVSVRAAHHAGS